MIGYFEVRIRGISRFLRRVILSFNQHDCPKQAAALSYYTLFSIFPLLLLLVYIASFFYPSQESRQTLADYLQSIIPYGADKLNDIVDQTYQARGTMGLVSGVSLLWGGSSIFNVLVSSFNKIWGSAPRSYIQRRGLAVMAVIAIVITFVASIIFGPLTNLLLERAGAGKQIFSYIFELISITMVLLLMYRVFPNQTVAWNAAFAGAFTAGILVIVTKYGFRLYTALVIDRNGLLYGSLTWILTVALWVYLLATLALFGAEFAAAYQRRQEIIQKNKEAAQRLQNEKE